MYGESRVAAAHTDALHIEDIPSRSRKYHWRIDTHRHHKLCQCIFVTSGAAAVDLDGARSAFEGSGVIVIPAGTVHGFRFQPETQGYVLTVDLDRLLSMAAAPHQGPIQALFLSSRCLDLTCDVLFAERAGRLLGTLIREFQLPHSLSAPMGSWLACSVLWLIAQKAAGHASADSPAAQDLDRLGRYRQLIESNWVKHWPVARYARALALSEASLNRLCRRLTGETASDVIQHRLALEARRRLLYVAGSVTSLAGELGFKDAAYFCRFFRRHNGLSPGEYRRRHSGG